MFYRLAPEYAIARTISQAIVVVGESLYMCLKLFMAAFSESKFLSRGLNP